MGYKIAEIEGIGEAFRAKLEPAGIKTTDDLLTKCGARKGREVVAESTGISAKLLLNWTNKADLMRVSGIGPQFAELLEAAGVDTIKELATRRADNLAAKMTEVNEQKHLAKSSPAESLVSGWIKAAAGLPPGVSH